MEYTQFLHLAEEDNKDDVVNELLECIQFPPEIAEYIYYYSIGKVWRNGQWSDVYVYTFALNPSEYQPLGSFPAWGNRVCDPFDFTPTHTPKGISP